ncbi:Hypothetical protein PBC10988_14440 [Planctomycetales bacterium 10988]|nr:Hypothetical protein PBC10988_14440 [Planctomycetales bacterium 10988]
MADSQPLTTESLIPRRVKWAGMTLSLGLVGAFCFRALPTNLEPIQEVPTDSVVTEVSQPFAWDATPKTNLIQSPTVPATTTPSLGETLTKFPQRQESNPFEKQVEKEASVRPAWFTQETPPETFVPEYPTPSRLESPASTWPAEEPTQRLTPEEVAESQKERLHTIRDGDTLAKLAKAYLGDAARAEEIFDWNRDRLSHPGRLLIGTVLRIPPAGSPARSQSPGKVATRGFDPYATSPYVLPQKNGEQAQPFIRLPFLPAQ